MPAKVMRGEMSAEDLAYKLPADGQIWGGKYPRPSALAKVTGTLDYGADLGLKLPSGCTASGPGAGGYLPRQHSLIWTPAKPKKCPGVVKVVTHKDIKGKNRISGSHHLSLKPGRRLGPAHSV